nr:unnamed protein product [Callosobruchus analis]
MLISQFQNAYGPSKELSLDEIYQASNFGWYVLNIEMYSGAEHKDINMTKTTALVLRLLKPYLMKGHKLFMDNYYNVKLLNLKTHTIGTLRANRRGHPKQLVKRKLKKGEHFWLRKRYVYISKWKDKRDVLMITTRNHLQLTTSKNWFGKEKVKLEVVMYHEHMSMKTQIVIAKENVPVRRIFSYSHFSGCLFLLLGFEVLSGNSSIPSKAAFPDGRQSSPEVLLPLSLERSSNVESNEVNIKFYK